MIFTYNKEQVGDVLMVIVAEDKGQPVQFERKGQVARVFLEETGKTENLKRVFKKQYLWETKLYG